MLTSPKFALKVNEKTSGLFDQPSMRTTNNILKGTELVDITCE